MIACEVEETLKAGSNHYVIPRFCFLCQLKGSLRHCARTQTPLFFTVLTGSVWNVAWAEDSPRCVDAGKCGGCLEHFQICVTVGQRRPPTRAGPGQAGPGRAGPFQQVHPSEEGPYCREEQETPVNRCSCDSVKRAEFDSSRTRTNQNLGT